MIETLQVELKQERIWQYTEIVYKQAPAWFGHISRPLKMGMLQSEITDGPKRPVIIWLCGGAWVDVNKDVWMPEMVTFAKAGFVVASVEYRLSHEGKFPAQIEDVKAAIRYLRANAAQYNIDPLRMAIMGESAGGYLTALAGTTGDIRLFDVGENSDQSSAVQAVVDWYGPTDFLGFEASNREAGYGHLISPEALLLGETIAINRETAVKASPITYITQKTPPFLILHGTADDAVPISQSDTLYEALKEKGVTAEYLKIAGAGHATSHFIQEEIKERILDFLKRHL